MCRRRTGTTPVRRGLQFESMNDAECRKRRDTRAQLAANYVHLRTQLIVCLDALVSFLQKLYTRVPVFVVVILRHRRLRNEQAEVEIAKSFMPLMFRDAK